MNYLRRISMNTKELQAVSMDEFKGKTIIWINGSMPIQKVQVMYAR